MASPMTKWVGAIDVGGTNIRAACVSSDGKIACHVSEPIVREKSPKKVTAQIGEFARKIEKTGNAEGIRVGRIGICVPGFLSWNRVVRSSPNFPGWLDVPLYELLEKEISLPFALENDGNCHALGEGWRGRAAGKKNAIVLVLGTGVGGGVISNGQLIRGHTGAAGEIGHVVVDPKGIECGCGSRGCLETLVSGSALERISGQKAEKMEEKARGGDATARAAWTEMGKWLGIGLTSLCFIFEPEGIVLGGKVSRAFDLFISDARETLLQRVRNHPSREVQMAQAEHLDDAGLLGAAWLALHADRVKAS